MGNFSLVVVPPYDLLRLDYVLARAGAVFDDPVPVSLLPTSFGIPVVLGFVLPHLFIPLVYFALVLPLLFHASLDRIGEDDKVEQHLLVWRWVRNNSVPLFPDILAGLLVGFTRLQPLAFVPVCSQLLPEI